MKAILALLVVFTAMLWLDFSAVSGEVQPLAGGSASGAKIASGISPRFAELVAETKMRIPAITSSQLRARMLRGDSRFFVIDVREDSEWAQGHLPGAIHLSKGVIERDIERTVSDPDSPLILYCGSGTRSVLAADNLGRMGYTDVFNLEGGIRGWIAAGYPIVKD